MTTTIDFDDLVREQRFDRMVRTERARIVRTVFGYCGNWADAEEAVQEVLAALWADRANLDDVTNLAGWTVTRAKYAALRLAEQRRKATPALLGEHIERVETQTPMESTQSGPSLDDPEVAARVRVALAAMTPSQRRVVQLHCLHGVSIAETAKKLGISRGNVSQRLYEALNLVDLSGPAWVDHLAELGYESPEAKAFRACPGLVKLLPSRQRRAVQLRYIQGLSRAEVGKRLGISVSSVSNLLRAARATVRELSAGLVSA
ncbi:sigma-70 family RNA polymerase sigma factor [Micromonospora sp. NPDC049891]|uniref:sigma-70 family RNA polymerase sigma factor n=1 Tax=Micromonospora sp. NPDC049891 TaxID=3155655 RepID=UPI0033EA9237